MSARRAFSLWGPVLLEAAVLFWLSSRTFLTSSPAGWDKVAHFLAYGALCTLLLRALHGGLLPLRLTLGLAAVALATAYGASDEFHQSFVPGRDASVFDLAADFLGAASAVALWVLLSKRRGVYSSTLAPR